MTAHTLEGRVYKQLGRDFEVRLTYRSHVQGQGTFWCNSRPDNGGDIGCYGLQPTYHSFDPKFGTMDTDLAEVKLTWDLRTFNGRRFMDTFAPGSISVSYGYFFQSTPYGQEFDDINAPPVLGELPFTRNYGGAHLIQTGYSLPF